MASSYINIKEKGFWARDNFVEAIQICLVNEIELNGLDSSDWINEYKNELALQALPIVYGGMSLELEMFIIDANRKSILIKSIDSIIKKIETDKDYLTWENLHKFRIRAIKILAESGKVKFKDEEDFLMKLI